MRLTNFLWLIIVGLLFSAEVTPADYFVNPSGNDQWSGTLRQPDGKLKDGPFKTLERAKQAIKALKQKGAFKDPVTVHISAGHYYLDQPLRFDMLDSGFPDRPIRWQGESGGKVIISGGIPVACKKLNNKLWQCPVKQIPFNKTSFDAQRIKGKAPPFDVFVDEQRLELARWPDQGWAHIKTPLDEKTQFSVIEPLPAFKEDIGNARVHIFPGNDWYDQYIGVDRLDSDANAIKLSDKSGYPLISGRRFYLQNLIAALNAPGEWFYDRQNARILLIPPQNPAPQQVVLSSLPNVILLDGANHLSFANLSIRHSAATAVSVKNAAHIDMEHLDIGHTGGKGVEIGGGRQVLLRNSAIHHTGAEAVHVGGGDSKTLEPCGHVIDNNHIHHMSSVILTSTPGIRLWGVGVAAKHNLLEQGAGSAILIEGNDHLIEKNELHHFCLQASDCGAIYSGRRWQWRGNVIRHNYIHDIPGYGLESVDLANNTVTYRSPRDARGVYLDDGASGFEIDGNIFENIGRIGLSIGGGRDNKIHNNYFKTAGYAIMVDDRWPDYNWNQNQKFLTESPYQSPIWRAKYPELAAPMRNYKWPEGNRIERNIIISTQPGGLALRYFIPAASTIIRRNLVWGVAGAVSVDYKLLEAQQNASVPWRQWMSKGIEQDSIYADPCISISDNKMTACPTSAVWDIGFRPLPEDIGLIK